MEVGKLRNKIELAIPVPNRSGNPIEIINEIKNIEKGVYAFYSGENELLYIGKTTDLKSRIFSHISGQSRNTKDIYHLFDRLKIWIFDNEADIDIFETYLINRLKPKYNVAKTFYKKELICQTFYYLSMISDTICSVSVNLKV